MGTLAVPMHRHQHAERKVPMARRVEPEFTYYMSVNSSTTTFYSKGIFTLSRKTNPLGATAPVSPISG